MKKLLQDGGGEGHMATQTMEHETLDLGVMSSSLMFGVELTLKKKR